jgi:predicted aspartyl protease
MKTPYSREYSPPAPVLSVSLAATGEAPGTNSVIALVDTGADGTFVPTGWLEQLRVPAIYVTNVRSHLAATLHRVLVYKVDILFDSLRLPNIDVVRDDWASEIIIGRNVLNKLHLFLDGPNQMTEFK